MDETTNQTSNNQENQNGRWSWIVTGVVVVAIAVAFYVWPKSSGEEAAVPESTESMVAEETDEYTASLQNVGISDEVSDIENDLKGTNVDDLDREVLDVESEIGAE
ncbi:MAG: hypothetical protein WAP55_01755 [Minisyncoccia bacterium]